MCCLSITIGRHHTGIKSMEEIWKPVVGWEGVYEVSNLGNVKRIMNGFVLKPSVQTAHACKNPYKRLRVGLWKNNKGKQYKIHRLVAEAFIPNPENKPQVNHKDNNPLNNNINNLEWVTGKENIHYAMNQGRMNRGSNNGMSKLQKEDILSIRKSNETKKEIMNRHSISKSYLNQLLRGERWSHV